MVAEIKFSNPKSQVKCRRHKVKLSKNESNYACNKIYMVISIYFATKSVRLKRIFSFENIKLLLVYEIKNRQA